MNNKNLIIERVKEAIFRSTDTVSPTEIQFLNKFLSCCYDNGWFSTFADYDNGCYIELFAVKDGIRYNRKVINLNDATKTLVNGLMDGVDKLWTET